MSESRMRAIESVLSRFEPDLMRLPNVVGVGVGKRDAEDVIKVFVVRKIPVSELSLNEVVPPQVGGVPVDVEEVGHVRALDDHGDA